jgi:hypothetical protein
MLIRLVGLALAIINIALVCYWAGSFTAQQWTLWRFAGITVCLAIFTFGVVLAVFGSSRHHSAPK